MTNKKEIVLIIEDEIDLRRLIRNKLINGGFDALEAGDGKIGLQMALSQHPDIILLDILMPVMDGLLMLKELRQNENGKNIPVIILSNLERTKAVDEGLEADFHDYFMKSDLKLDDIVNLIKNKINERK